MALSITSLIFHFDLVTWQSLGVPEWKNEGPGLRGRPPVLFLGPGEARLLMLGRGSKNTRIGQLYREKFGFVFMLFSLWKGILPTAVSALSWCSYSSTAPYFVESLFFPCVVISVDFRRFLQGKMTPPNQNKSRRQAPPLLSQQGACPC